MGKKRSDSNRECWFLDVGQGASNVILLGGGRAIVIDCGPRGSQETIRLLKQWVDTIEAIIITHNDEDHDFNTPQILNEFRKAIKRVFFLQDRNVQKIKLYRTIGTLISDENHDFPLPMRLEANGGKPRVLFSEGDLTLSVMYPDLIANLGVQNFSTFYPNRTSAILRLTCHDRRIVFSGDATIEAWEYVASNLKTEKPLKCDIMTIPHHGGRISEDETIEATCQSTFYSEIVRPKYGIISVGTINPYGHPLMESVSAAINAGVKVFCTQMTNKCCDDLESIRSRRRTIVRPARSSRDESRTGGGRSRHVACFGSVVAEVSPSRITIANLPSYEDDMLDFTKLNSFHPVCKSNN